MTSQISADQDISALSSDRKAALSRRSIPMEKFAEWGAGSIQTMQQIGSCIRGWSGSALNPKTNYSPSIQEIRIRGCALNP